MAKFKRSSKPPQAKHQSHKTGSQFDKRSRLDSHNPDRQKTTHAKFPLVATIADKVSQLASLLDARSGFRLSIIMAGMMLADDRRVAAAWFASAGVQDDWETIVYRCRGGEVTRQYKTFLATSRLTGGVIRAVIVKFDNGGWATYFCTKAEVSVRDILETIADRWVIEEFFHDTKEVWGAGQQQVRNVWSNIGCWHLNMWMYTLVEMCSWESSQEELSDRSDRPWDNPDRRPSHADKRRSISHKMLQNQFNVVLPDTPEKQQLQSLIDHLIRLAA